MPPPMINPAASVSKWTDRLAFDIALALEGSGEKTSDILKHHEVTQKDFIHSISKDPVFLKKLGEFRDDIRANGLTFRMKARAQAEDLLTTSWALIHDINTSPAVKADLIKSTVKWAGLEPKDKDSGQGGGGVTITINLGDSEQNKLPITLSDEPEQDPESEPLEIEYHEAGGAA